MTEYWKERSYPYNEQSRKVGYRNREKKMRDVYEIERYFPSTLSIILKSGMHDSIDRHGLLNFNAIASKQSGGALSSFYVVALDCDRTRQSSPFKKIPREFFISVSIKLTLPF